MSGHDGEATQPTEAIKEVKKRRKEEVERLRDETRQAKEQVTGNPTVVEALEKLEERVERLEDEIL